MIIGVLSQKGGQGKSTIISNLATKIQTQFNPEKNPRRVAVIDGDYPQLSNYLLREREKNILTDTGNDIHEVLKKKYVTTYKEKDLKPYAIIAKDLLDIPEYLNEIKNQYDIIFLDIVGSVNTEGYGSSFLNLLDYIVLPTLVEYDDVTSNLAFIKNYIAPLKMGKYSAEFLSDIRINDQEQQQEILESYKRGEYEKYSNLKDFAVLFNRIENNANGDIRTVEMWKESLSTIGVSTFNQSLFKRKKYSRWFIQDTKNGAKSTLIPFNDTYINRLTEEFINFVKL